MRALISKAETYGSISAISSKSMAHRLLICAAFADNSSVIRCETHNEDILATVKCLTDLGAKIEYKDGSFYIEPITAINNSPILDCNESGSTLRFLIPVVCAICDSASFLMSGRLPERPLSPLREELEIHGISFDYSEKNVLNTKGRLSSGSYTISGEISSQFISGLLFALSILDGNSTLTVTGKLESAPYVQMTLDSLALFGANIKRKDNVFSIIGGKLHAPQNLFVEGDWSNAAFPLCLGAVSGGVTVYNLNFDSAQGDKEIISILRSFGADVLIQNDSITVKINKLCGIELDASHIPDLVPVIATVASVAEGQTVIYGAKRLRIKESDRLFTTKEMLSSLGADITETDDGLIINGKKGLDGGTVSSYNDHRIAMSAAVASAVCKGSVTVTDAEAVNKSYPDFWKDVRTLGLDISFTDKE